MKKYWEPGYIYIAAQQQRCVLSKELNKRKEYIGCGI